MRSRTSGKTHRRILPVQYKPVTRIIATSVWTAKKIAISMITFGLPHSFAVSRSSSPQHSWHLPIHVCVCLVLWADCPISYRTTIIIPMTISYWTSDGVTHSNVSAGTCRLLLAETSLFSFLIQFRIIHIIVLSYYNGNIFFSFFVFTVLDRCFFLCMYAEVRPEAALPCFALPA